VATECGGTSGGSARHGVQPPYPEPPQPKPPYPKPAAGEGPAEQGEHEPGGQPSGEREPAGQERAETEPSGYRSRPQVSGPGSRKRGLRLLAFAAIVLGTLGFASSLWGLKGQLLPRRFATAQQEQITSWEYAKRWRLLPAGTIFPAAVRYIAPAALDDDPSLALTATRLGIARQDSCAKAADPTAARVLDRNGCTAMLRATYTDSTDSYVMTVGAAVMPGVSQAAAAARALSGTGNGQGLQSGVRTVPVKGTPSAAFTNQRRQLSGAVTEGSYVVLYTVGYADTRPREKVSGDSYADAEMTSAGRGVAQAVRQVLGAPVPAPRCPGTPGC
jgi:hypothetical protein